MDTIPLLLVDDAPLFRRGVRAAIEEVPAAFTVVGEAADGPRALELALTHAPSVVLLNAAVAGRDGLALIRTLKQRVPGAAVIVVVDHEEEDTLFAAITYGASAYLPKASMRTPCATCCAGWRVAPTSLTSACLRHRPWPRACWKASVP